MALLTSLLWVVSRVLIDPASFHSMPSIAAMTYTYTTDYKVLIRATSWLCWWAQAVLFRCSCFSYFSCLISDVAYQSSPNFVTCSLLTLIYKIGSVILDPLLPKIWQSPESRNLTKFWTTWQLKQERVWSNIIQAVQGHCAKLKLYKNMHVDSAWRWRRLRKSLVEQFCV